MPFYEYQCKNCGHTLEAMQKISEAPLKKCPHCGKPRLERLMSAPVFRLKGGGWYETDFKGDQDPKRNLADRPEPEAKDDKKAAVETTKDDGKAAEASGEKPTEKASDKPAVVAEPAKKVVGGAAKKRSTAVKPAKKASKKPVAKAKKRR